MMLKKIKLRIFEVIESANKGDNLSKLFDIIIIFLIILNLITVITETFKIPHNLIVVMTYIEIISVIIFTIEYALRVWTADLLYPQYSVVMSRIKYIFSFMALIDLLSILPFYLPFVIPLDLRVLRTLRIIKLFRILKINRYTSALQTIAEVFKRKSSQLISSMFVVLLLMIMASVLMYNVENDAQPDKFSNALDTMWWSVATLTTVGYGDVYPITAVGRVLATIIAFLGIGMVAVPTGIITSGFSEVFQDEKQINNYEKYEKYYCPYCGHRLDK